MRGAPIELAGDDVGLVQVFGIDFSAAADVGRRIWIASGVPDGDGLDSVLAALAVWRAVRDPRGLACQGGDASLIEGHIYV